jgi:hypothetical protein
MNFKFTAQKTSRKYVRSGKPGGLKGIKLKRISCLRRNINVLFEKFARKNIRKYHQPCPQYC